MIGNRNILRTAFTSACLALVLLFCKANLNAQEIPLYYQTPIYYELDNKRQVYEDLYLKNKEDLLFSKMDSFIVIKNEDSLTGTNITQYNYENNYLKKVSQVSEFNSQIKKYPSSFNTISKADLIYNADYSECFVYERSDWIYPIRDYGYNPKLDVFKLYLNPEGMVDSGYKIHFDQVRYIYFPLLQNKNIDRSNYYFKLNELKDENFHIDNTSNEIPIYNVLHRRWNIIGSNIAYLFKNQPKFNISNDLLITNPVLKTNILHKKDFLLPKKILDNFDNEKFWVGDEGKENYFITNHTAWQINKANRKIKTIYSKVVIPSPGNPVRGRYKRPALVYESNGRYRDYSVYSLSGGYRMYSYLKYYKNALVVKSIKLNFEDRIPDIPEIALDNFIRPASSQNFTFKKQERRMKNLLNTHINSNLKFYFNKDNSLKRIVQVLNNKYVTTKTGEIKLEYSGDYLVKIQLEQWNTKGNTYLKKTSFFTYNK